MAQPTGSQHTDPQSDIDIARAATKRPILDIAQDRLGIAPEASGPLRPRQGEDHPRPYRLAGGPAGRQADPGHGDHADAGRRGQDHHHRRPRRRPQPDRQEHRHGAARAEPRPLLRRQGRRRRRRLRPGGADGGHQPPLHRRFSCHRRRQQPAGGDGGQPHLLGQQGRHRPAPGELAPRRRHERPGAAQRGLVARRRRQRFSA